MPHHGWSWIGLYDPFQDSQVFVVLETLILDLQYPILNGLIVFVDVKVHDLVFGRKDWLTKGLDNPQVL